MASTALWAAVLLPQLPIEVLLRGVETSGPTVVVHGRAQSPNVAASNEEAKSCGVQDGMGLAGALAVSAELQVLNRNEAAEREALENVAEWAGQFTAMVSIVESGMAGLVLEIGGSLRLFGDDPKVVGSQLRSGLTELGFSPVIAAAPTPTAAWWLVRSGIQTLIRDVAKMRQRLSKLPINAMDIKTSKLDGLWGIGVRTVGDCEKLPRGDAARRFGPDLHQQLDKAMARAADPREPYVRPERLVRALSLPSPVASVEAILFALGRIIRDVIGVLISTGRAPQMLELTLIHSNEETSKLTLALIAPSRDAQHFLGLLRHRLESLQIHDPIESLSLMVHESVHLAPSNYDLFNDGDIRGRSGHREEWLAVIERLHARLGAERVQAMEIVSDHRPEHAWRAVSPLAGGATDNDVEVRGRPLWLLPEPEALENSMGQLKYRGHLTLESPAERLEGGWWAGHDERRDYHVAVNEQGERFWVYQDKRKSSWYLHGVFA